MTDKAKRHYEQLFGRKWKDMNPADQKQLEQIEANKIPVKGTKLLKHVKYPSFVFSKKIINKD